MFVDNSFIPEVTFDPFIWLQQVKMKGILPTVVLWKCWCARNKFVFEGVRSTTVEITNQSHAFYHDILKAYAPSNADGFTHTMVKEVAWCPPPSGWVALNVDGSALANPGMTGYGGLIRDSEGNFNMGFYGALGYSNILHAELIALVRGISLCWHLGYRKVVCYTDSLHSLRRLNDANTSYHKYGNEIAQAKLYLQKDWEVKLIHAYREANFCADFLAKMGVHCGSPFVQVSSPPSGLEPHLSADALGVSFVRP